MYKISSGTTHGMADTAAFIGLLERLPESLPGESKDFFGAGDKLYVSRAPGRLDLMGGIADYSGSLVLELTIASATHAALQLQEHETLRLVSLPSGQNEPPRLFEMKLADFNSPSGELLDYPAAAALFSHESGHAWAAYVAGAFYVLMRERDIRFKQGAHILISSQVPEGKGVSSSASLEVATMEAITAAYGLELSPRQIAFLCQKVENEVACAPCGVMDQMTSACGETDKLLALLCQPGELKGTVKLPDELKVWGIDSGIRHSVGGADYGTVRTAAFMGYRMIAGMAGLPCRETEIAGHVSIDDPKWHGYLANVTPDEFEHTYAAHLPARMPGAEFLERYKGITDRVTSVNPARDYPVRQATQHPVYEHERVRKFAAILENWKGIAQAAELGALMYESHESYSACRLGSPGTDELVGLVREAGAGSGLYGAKITGGGSGGTVAVLGRKGAEESIEAVTKEYARRTGHEPLVISGSSPGAGVFGHLELLRESEQERGQ